MDTHVISICGALLLFCTSLIANILGYVLTEVRRPLLPFKPFNCWGCLSFWLTLVFGLVVSASVAPYYRNPETQVVAWYGGLGVSVLLGLVNHLHIKTKYQVYE